jgi:hypothetical protein
VVARESQATNNSHSLLSSTKRPFPLPHPEPPPFHHHHQLSQTRSIHATVYDASAHLVPPALRRHSLDARCLVAHHRASSTCLPEALPNVCKLASPPFKDTNNPDSPAHLNPSPAHFQFSSPHHPHQHHAANPPSSTAPPSPCTTCATSS